MATVPSSHEDILNTEGFAHLASIGPEGEPQSHPVWYSYHAGHIWLSTTNDRQKLANVRRDQRVALTIQDPENPYRYVEVRGLADAVVPDTDRTFIDSLARRYLGEDEYPWHQPGDERVIIDITPTKYNTMGE